MKRCAFVLGSSRRSRRPGLARWPCGDAQRRRCCFRPTMRGWTARASSAPTSATGPGRPPTACRWRWPTASSSSTRPAPVALRTKPVAGLADAARAAAWRPRRRRRGAAGRPAGRLAARRRRCGEDPGAQPRPAGRPAARRTAARAVPPDPQRAHARRRAGADAGVAQVDQRAAAHRPERGRPAACRHRAGRDEALRPQAGGRQALQVSADRASAILANRCC